MNGFSLAAGACFASALAVACLMSVLSAMTISSSSKDGKGLGGFFAFLAFNQLIPPLLVSCLCASCMLLIAQTQGGGGP